MPGTMAFSGKFTVGVLPSAEGIRYWPLANLYWNNASAAGLIWLALIGAAPCGPVKSAFAMAAKPSAVRLLSVSPAGTVTRDKPIS